MPEITINFYNTINDPGQPPMPIVLDFNNSSSSIGVPGNNWTQPPPVVITTSSPQYCQVSLNQEILLQYVTRTNTPKTFWVKVTPNTTGPPTLMGSPSPYKPVLTCSAPSGPTGNDYTINVQFK